MKGKVKHFLEKYLFIDDNEDESTITVPFHRVVQLIETYHASEVKRQKMKPTKKEIASKPPVEVVPESAFPTDEEIKAYAQAQTFGKNPDGKYTAESNLIRIGIERGMMDLRDKINKKEKI